MKHVKTEARLARSGCRGMCVKQLVVMNVLIRIMDIMSEPAQGLSSRGLTYNNLTDNNGYYSVARRREPKEGKRMSVEKTDDKPRNL